MACFGIVVDGSDDLGSFGSGWGCFEMPGHGFRWGVVWHDLGWFVMMF